MIAPGGGTSISGVRLVALLLVMVALSVLIHGYHYGIEDEAIYLPAIKAHLDPALYPHDAIFFGPQTKATLFDELVAVSSRMLHVRVDWMVFVYYLGTLLAFYGGLWALAARLFPEFRARLAGMLLVAVLLTIPITGTGIYIVDQHLHPRTLATALILFAISRLVPRAVGERLPSREYVWGALLMAGAALIHVQMAFYGSILIGLLLLPWQAFWSRWVMMGSFTPVLLIALLQKGGSEWQEAARTRTQHYLMQWQWYEWLGAIAPIFLLWGMGRLARRRGLLAASTVAIRLALFAAVGLVAGCVMTIPPQLERLTVYQPMRILHLTYIVMILLAGGLLADLALKQKLWRWTLLLVPIAIGMSFVQFQEFPHSRHVEWPGRATGNDWVEAFNWIKGNTDVDAYFVLDPHYMRIGGEDHHGFRGLAERGQLAEGEKDPGVALLFPELAKRWSHEVHALDGWRNFAAGDFHRLHEQFGVEWTVLPYHRTQGSPGEYVTMKEDQSTSVPIHLSDCPYRNLSVVVCRIK